MTKANDLVAIGSGAGRNAVIRECVEALGKLMPKLSGPEYGLADEASRREMRAQAWWVDECQQWLCALASPEKEVANETLDNASSDKTRVREVFDVHDMGTRQVRQREAGQGLSVPVIPPAASDRQKLVRTLLIGMSSDEIRQLLYDVKYLPLTSGVKGWSDADE